MTATATTTTNQSNSMQSAFNSTLIDSGRPLVVVVVVVAGGGAAVVDSTEYWRVVGESCQPTCSVLAHKLASLAAPARPGRGLLALA